MIFHEAAAALRSPGVAPCTLLLVVQVVADTSDLFAGELAHAALTIGVDDSVLHLGDVDLPSLLDFTGDQVDVEEVVANFHALEQGSSEDRSVGADRGHTLGR